MSIVELTENEIEVRREILYTREDIQARAREIGHQVHEDYQGLPLRILIVLRGGANFGTDLHRALFDEGTNCPVEFCKVSSYGDSEESSGQYRVDLDVPEDLNGWHVLIVEDIADTGGTLAFLKNRVIEKGAESARIAVMFDKYERRTQEVTLDYLGFSTPDRWLEGYGMDSGGLWRGSADVWARME